MYTKENSYLLNFRRQLAEKKFWLKNNISHRSMYLPEFFCWYWQVFYAYLAAVGAVVHLSNCEHLALPTGSTII